MDIGLRTDVIGRLRNVWMRAVIIILCGATVIALGKTFTSTPTSLLNTTVKRANPMDTKQLIRFHVIANSDSEDDQALKRAVRDQILLAVSPRLAESKSLEESRKILQSIRPEMETIARRVVKDWGQTYSVKTEYGQFSFPTKSYGSLVLPAGQYEALKVIIGQGEGSNWWCVLFPPLCFVDIDHSTAVPVDGKPGIPLQRSGPNPNINPGTEQIKKAGVSLQPKKEIRFFFWELIKKWGWL